MIRVFVSYSRKDEAFVRGEDGLIPWLEDQLEHERVKFWCDPSLSQQPGVDYTARITEEIEACHAAILLVSQDFVSSKFIRSVELPLIRKRFEAKQIQVIPILVDVVDWTWNEEAKWIATRQVIPSATQPLAEMQLRGGQLKQARLEIAKAIRETIRAIAPQAVPPPTKDNADLSAQLVGVLAEVRDLKQRVDRLEKGAPTAAELHDLKQRVDRLDTGAPTLAIRNLAKTGETPDHPTEAFFERMRKELTIDPKMLLIGKELVADPAGRPTGSRTQPGEKALAVLYDERRQGWFFFTDKAVSWGNAGLTGTAQIKKFAELQVYSFTSSGGFEYLQVGTTSIYWPKSSSNKAVLLFEVLRDTFCLSK